ncbi:MAG: hypothetical protein MUP71_03780 [Candidatus Aminicenantes bacterium]|nr:hypothetical protein [Candidatus Aminicenantes bacterium]
MKKSKLFIIAALALAILFLSQFAAEILFLTGPVPELGKKMAEPTLDLKAFSFSSRLYTESAFAWLEAGTSAKDERAVKKSMTLLRQALRRNPLDYQARYYLAKAYLQFSAANGDYFDLGVRELKRAARIRGNNKQIALDCGRIFFSLWPLLEDGDKAFATGLLVNVMPALSWSEFSPLLEMWSFYVQEAPLLMELLQRKPEFFGPAADQLVAAALPIEQRHELLSLYEVHTLDAMERRYNELSLQGEIGLDDVRSLLNQLRQVKGYFRLQPASGFAPEKMADLQREFLLRVISGLLGETKAPADPKSILQVREYVQAYIVDHSGLNDLDDLQKLLEEKNYFKNNDFPSLYLKTLIAYKKNSYPDIIAEIEALRQTISFVKKEQLADYTNILLLLIDSYYSTKLMTAAESVAKELYENQPDNSDVLFRVLRIRNILGVEGAPDPVLDAKLETVQNSRFLTITKTKSSHDVFLFNAPEIEITFDPNLLTQLKPKQLVQVFVEGRIAFENYVDGLPETIILAPPFTGIERKVKVQVNIL